MLWLVMPSSGSCQLLPAVSQAVSGPISIGQPVGRGPLARNKADDVRTIQEALNEVTVLGEPGGPMPFLKVDGICGPKTNAAIARFQQVQLKIFDGVIEPNKKTIVRLNQIVAPVSDDDLKAKLQLALPIVSRAIDAALRNLTAATERFNIAAFDEFDVDRNNPKIALTRRNGFFQEGQEDPQTHRRLDHIHLGFGFFAPKVSPDFGAFIILHELAHFVGRATGQEVFDFGRGWFNEPFIVPLSAEQRLGNAESYATFAFECLNDKPDKPLFVQSSPGGLGGAR